MAPYEKLQVDPKEDRAEMLNLMGKSLADSLCREFENTITRNMQGQGILRNCVNCSHFDEKNELCKFNNYNTRPPARVIAYGCKKHDDNDLIPF